MILPILKTFCQQVPVLSGGLCICIYPSLVCSDSLLDSPLTQKGLTTLGSQNCKEGFTKTTFIQFEYQTTIGKQRWYLST